MGAAALQFSWRLEWRGKGRTPSSTPCLEAKDVPPSWTIAVSIVVSAIRIECKGDIAREIEHPGKVQNQLSDKTRWRDKGREDKIGNAHSVRGPMPRLRKGAALHRGCLNFQVDIGYKQGSWNAACHAQNEGKEHVG